MTKSLSYILYAAVLVLSLTYSACGTDAPGDAQTTATPASSKAIQQLNTQIEDDNDNPNLYNERGVMHFRLENFVDAAQDLERAIQLDSSKLEYYLNLRDAYLSGAQSRAALKLMLVAVERFPQDKDLPLELASLQYQLQQYNEAIITLDNILKVNPADADAHFNKGLIYKEIGDTSQALNAFQTAVEMNANLSEGYIQLGKLFASQGNSNAIRYFDNALRIDTMDYVALHSKASFYHQGGQLDRAEVLYKLLITRHSQNPDPHYDLGLLFMEQGRYAEAKQEFNLSVKMDPAFARAYYFRGYADELQDNKEEAALDYDRALRFDPDLNLAKQGLIRLGKEVPQ